MVLYKVSIVFRQTHFPQKAHTGSISGPIVAKDQCGPMMLPDRAPRIPEAYQSWQYRESGTASWVQSPACSS